ncbi:hypothetical protein S83_020340 [Arachis hypogaea]
MSNAKRIESAVQEYACNALFLKSKIQKQPIRQNPEATLCCDVHHKAIGRSEKLNAQKSNEQTIAAANAFLHSNFNFVGMERARESSSA